MQPLATGNGAWTAMERLSNTPLAKQHGQHLTDNLCAADCRALCNCLRLLSRAAPARCGLAAMLEEVFQGFLSSVRRAALKTCANQPFGPWSGELSID